MPFEQLTVVTDAAGNGIATTEYIEGYIVAVVIDYDAGAAGGTDLVISQTTPPLIPILTLTNNNADGIWYPRAAICDILGVTPIFYDVAGIPNPQVEVKDKIFVCGEVSAIMAQAGGATINTVWVQWEFIPHA